MGVFRDSFEVAVQFLGDRVECYSFVTGNEKQDLKPSMVCRSLKISLKLFSRLHMSLTIPHPPKYSDILKNVGIL